MLFNSSAYALFLPLVFLFYWLTPGGSLRLQNLFLLLVSYLFYGWIRWELVLLILATTVVDYSVALAMDGPISNGKRKILLIVSIAANVGVLIFFKYHNFFIENFAAVFSWVGLRPGLHTFQIILPVGISFYTFQSMGYTIDVYRRELRPEKDFILFATFISFFPQLVAGPIERGGHLLPQFREKRRFDYGKAADGLRQMLWGYFKKIVIADNCGKVADLVFNNSHHYTGAALLLGALFFVIQLYCDFSGYSDIAIGSARLIGFDLVQNFAFPFFSRNIAEFWRRWHMSLYSWFRDYVYIPLGGNRNGKWRTLLNVIIVFLLSGLWHGAAWHFILWGLINAIFFLPALLGSQRKKAGETADFGSVSFANLLQMGLTFLLVCFSMIFFRAADVHEALYFVTRSLSGLFSRVAFKQALQIAHGAGYIFIALIVAFFGVEWAGRCGKYGIEFLRLRSNPVLRYAIYYSIILTILLWGNFAESKFIYFQF